MDEKSFTQGYICAVANLIRLHDQPGMAEGLLSEIAPVDWRSIDAYDRKILRDAGLVAKKRHP